MSYSAPKNSFEESVPGKLSLLVFTNSRHDYRVTVRSPGDGPASHMQHAARWVDALARRCDGWLAKGGSAVVALVPSPDRPGQALAVRAFDVGEFRQRPHTLAIVAIELPPPWLEIHSVTRLLAALHPPKPDGAEYQLPSDQEIQASSIVGEPFASLAAWERAQRPRYPLGPVMFSEPPECGIEVARINGNPRLGAPPNRRRLIHLALVCGLIVSGPLVWVFARNSIQHSTAIEASDPSGHTREELLACLSSSGVQLTPELTTQQAVSIILKTAPILNRRMRDLQSALTSLAAEPARASLSTLIATQTTWAAPIRVPPQRPISSEMALDSAFAIHQAYQQIHRKLAGFEKLNSPSDEFKQDLTNLRLKLREALDLTDQSRSPMLPDHHPPTSG